MKKEQKNLIKINTLARFYGLNSSAIRYYEAYGLIKPAYVDPNTKYRYYDLDNVTSLSYILELKKAGMNMEETKLYMNSLLSREDFIKELQKKRDHIDKLISINSVKTKTDIGTAVEIIDIPEFYYCGKSYHTDGIDGIYTCFYDFLDYAVNNIIGITDGLAFIEYETIEPEMTNLDIKVYYKTNANSPDAEFHEAIHGIMTYHYGSYETIFDSYDRLLDYAKIHGLKIKGNALEQYLESFNFTGEKSYQTLIILPCEK